MNDQTFPRMARDGGAQALQRPAGDSQPAGFVSCYVINLPQAAGRRAAMASRLDAQGLPYRLFRAVDGRRLTAGERAAHVNDARALREGYALSPGEIGCALSHLAIYRDMVNHDTPYAVVLEDDVCLAGDFARLLDPSDPAGLASLFHPEDAAVVQLTHVRRGYRLGSRPVGSGHRLVRPHGGVWRASAYFLTLGAARRLAEGLYPIWTVADDWRRIEGAGLVALHALTPNCAWESRESLASDIEPERRPRRPAARTLATRLRRWVDDLVVRPLLVRRLERAGGPPPAPEGAPQHASKQALKQAPQRTSGQMPDQTLQGEACTREPGTDPRARQPAA